MWTLTKDTALPLWRTTSPRPGALLAFSTRRGGTSLAPFDTLNLGRSTADLPEAVAENRRRLLESIGLPATALATAGQVHGARVVDVTAAGHHSDCDALVTRVPGLALAVTTADCMALLFEAPRAVAAAHSGWRGTCDGMPQATLDAVRSASDCSTGEVDVHFGPCIRGCCYEVGEEVASRFPAPALRRDGGRVHLDLPTAARLALEAAGMDPSHIHDTGACTACEPHWYFSHRRDEGRTGRLWGVAVRTSAD